MPPSPSGPNARRRAFLAGRRGEAWAALYLRLKFYRVRAVRHATPLGEIDIVAERGDTLVFIEVKTRRGRAEPWEAVNTRRIADAAALYVARNPGLAGRKMRFDVIFLAPFAWPRHVINAFDASP